MKNCVLHSFFSTPILFSEDAELAEQLLPDVKRFLDKKELIEEILGYRSTYTLPENSQTDADRLGLSKFDEFKQFSEQISITAVNFLKNIGYDYQRKLKTYLFASEMTYGNYHVKHTHPGALVSGVFYLQVPENSANIVFYDPRAFHNILAIPKQHQDRNTLVTNSFVNNSITLVPKVGRMFMWQSWLEHSVIENKSKEPRITLTFNCF